MSTTSLGDDAVGPWVGFGAAIMWGAAALNLGILISVAVAFLLVPQDWSSWLIPASCALGTWRLVYYPKFRIAGPDLEARNPLRTRTVELAVIKRVLPSPEGLQVWDLNESYHFTVWPAQKGFGAHWLRIRTRADDLAHAIEMAAERARGARDEDSP